MLKESKSEVLMQTQSPTLEPAGPLSDLFRNAKRLSAHKNEIVLRPDDEAPGAFFIQTGYVKVFSINNRGEEYLHIIYGPGEIFPLIWAVLKKQRNVFYKTICNTKLLQISENSFSERLKSDNQICYELLKQSSTQFNIYANRVDNLEYKYGRERLAYRLLFLASHLGVKDRGKILLPPVTQQDIASSINLSRETASREIERLARLGVLSYKGRRLILNDIEKLSYEIKGVDLKLWGLD